MAEAHAVQKLIYLSLRETFAGESAQLRKKKKVKNVIEQNKQNPQIQDLIRKGHDIDKIASVAHVLLEEQVFESTTKAKARFPDAFQASVSSATATKMSEPKITTSSVATTESAIPKSIDKGKDNGPDKADAQITEIKPQLQIVSETPNSTILPGTTCLPFWYQHRIMIRVQESLEKACFNFALRNLGDTLQENAWDCAEAIELNRWPKILLKYQDELDQQSPEDVKKVLPKLSTSINQIRHAAVHRLRLPARSVLDLITDAEALAKLLQDKTGVEIISTIRQQISVTIKELEENKRSLDSRLTEIQKEFAEKRVQLAREEAALIERAKEESRENDFFTNANPDDPLDTVIAAQARWKQKSSGPLAIDETRGPVKTHEPGLGTEALYDPVVAVEEISQSSGSYISPAESQSKLNEESDGFVRDSNASSYDDLDTSTTICDMSAQHAGNPKVLAMFDQLDSCLQAYTTEGLTKLNTGLLSPSASECDYWATPWDSRSPTEATIAMDGLEDSEATSE